MQFRVKRVKVFFSWKIVKKKKKRSLLSLRHSFFSLFGKVVFKTSGISNSYSVLFQRVWNLLLCSVDPPLVCFLGVSAYVRPDFHAHCFHYFQNWINALFEYTCCTVGSNFKDIFSSEKIFWGNVPDESDERFIIILRIHTYTSFKQVICC